MNNILHGSAQDKLKELPSDSVDCCITSPPYWALRDYKTEGHIWDCVNGCTHEWTAETTKWPSSNGGNNKGDTGSNFTDYNDRKTTSDFCSKCNAWKGSLGLEPNFNLYIKHLVDIFSEVRRVLKKSGSCWVNLGDTYAGHKGQMRNPGFDDHSKGVQYRKDAMGDKEEYWVTGAPEKSLCLIPERFAIAMVDQGWILRNKIIWYKPNCMPSSAKDRFTVDWEYLFFFTKSQRYWFETQYEPLETEPHKPGNKGITNHWQTFVQGKTERSLRHMNEHVNEVWGSTLGRIKRCVWKIATQPFSEAHFATFPPGIVYIPLMATCPVNGIVLDPFMGSGTVPLVALQNARNFIGIELNESYIDMALKRLEPYLLQTRLEIG